MTGKTAYYINHHTTRFIFTGSYQNDVRIIDRHKTDASTYKLKMECDTSLFYSNFYGDADAMGANPHDPSAAPWPRPLVADMVEATGDTEVAANFPVASLFSPSTVKKWISVSWCPNSTVAAACHSDAIHIVEGVGSELRI